MLAILSRSCKIEEDGEFFSILGTSVFPILGDAADWMEGYESVLVR